jgi:ABC-type hemin transport system ATPase subunit
LRECLEKHHAAVSRETLWVNLSTFVTLKDMKSITGEVSLALGSREIAALIGANTAGKSTLLDALSGFLHPFKGSS